MFDFLDPMSARKVAVRRRIIERDRCPEAVNRIRHTWEESAVGDPTSWGSVIGFIECKTCGKVEYT